MLDGVRIVCIPHDRYTLLGLLLAKRQPLMMATCTTTIHSTPKAKEMEES